MIKKLKIDKVKQAAWECVKGTTVETPLIDLPVSLFIKFMQSSCVPSCSASSLPPEELLQF